MKHNFSWILNLDKVISERLHCSLFIITPHYQNLHLLTEQISLNLIFCGSARLSVAPHSWTSCIPECSSDFLPFLTRNLSQRLKMQTCRHQGLFRAISVFFLMPHHRRRRLYPQNIHFASCLPFLFTATPHFLLLLPESALLPPPLPPLISRAALHSNTVIHFWSKVMDEIT